MKLFLHRIIKTGHNISGDAKKLYQDYGLQVRGCVELTHLIKNKCKFYPNLEIESQSRSNKKVHLDRLDGLVYFLLNGLDMEKNKSITMSNWENNPLTIKQIKYAANDAILSFYIFLQAITNLNNLKINTNVSHFSDFFQIKNQSITKNPNNNIPIISFDIIDNSLSNNDILKICYGIIDVKILKLERKVYVNSNKIEKKCNSKDCDLENIRLLREKEREREKLAFQRKKKYKELASRAHSRKKPLYDNCRLLKKDGTLISRCSARKLQWYLNQGIARAHESDAKAIYLDFEPKTVTKDKFRQIGKENICVVCGTDKNLVRYYIVPQYYRKLFPKTVKDDSIRDIVLVCINDDTKCHSKAQTNEDNFRSKLSKQYNIIPWNARFKDFYSNKYYTNSTSNNINTNDNILDDFDLKQYVCKCAKILDKQKNKLPRQRSDRLKAVIAKYYGLMDTVDDNDSYSDEKDTNNNESEKKDQSEAFLDQYAVEKIDTSLFELDKVNEELIVSAMNLVPSKEEENEIRKQIFQVHCKQAVSCFSHDYHSLIRLWRQSFVDNLKPKFLPKHWSVDPRNDGHDE